MSHVNLDEQKGHYRYDPNNLDRKGPARIFAYSGEDGALDYILTKLRQDYINQGKLSEPWSLLLKEVGNRIDNLGKTWLQVSTLLVDWEIFQSGWFNFHLPPNEQFSVGYVRKRRDMAQRISAALKATENESSIEQKRSQFYQSLEKTAKPGNYVPTRSVASVIHERDGGLSDREFARQRLAGHNPTVLHRVNSKKQSILQAWATQPYQLADGSTIDLIQSAAENRLFIADYPLFKDLKATDLQPGKYLGSPTAVFYHSSQGLEPVLIEVEKGRVVTPTQDTADDWTRAKLYTQTADATYHELITHLSYTHLASESLAIALSRNLPDNHPVYQLLRPHFEFLIAINNRGNAILLNDGAAISTLMAPVREVSLDLMNKAYRERSFWDYALPNDIEHRGIEAKFIPEYPYRDDALLLWDAIAKYTSSYLQGYYPDDKAVLKDSYLQAWADELGAPLNTRPKSEFPQIPAWLPPEWAIASGLEPKELPPHPRVPGFTKITSLQQLIDIATIVIFTNAPQHAAVNFSQFDYVTYVPNAPFANYSRPDTPVSLQEFLPPPDKELSQMQLTFALSGIAWGQLGSSDLIKFANKSDRQILSQFQNELTDIEDKIKARNQLRLASTGVEYPYLLPSRIPNSINI